MIEDGLSWQAWARRQRDALVASFYAGQTLEEQRDAIVASFYADAPEPTAEDLIAEILALVEEDPALADVVRDRLAPPEEPADPEEFSSLVAAWDADYGEETPHNRNYVGSLTAAHAARGAVMVSTWRTERLPDDVPGLLAALDARDRAPGGIVAAVRAGEPVGPPVPRTPAQNAVVASVGQRAAYKPPNHPLARARRADRLQALLRRGDPSGTGSSAPLRSTITASSALPNAPDGTVLSWNDQRLNAQRRRSRLDELLGRSAVPS